MKKIMFVAAMAALVLSACSKSEVVERSSQGAIGFDSFVGKATKATPVSKFADGNTMSVWGFSTDNTVSDLAAATPITNLAGEVFTRSGGSNPVWTPTRTAYWLEGKKHHFLALAPSEAAGCTIAQSLATIMVQADLDNQKDILLAEPLLNKDYSAVAQTFNFRHVLSQVKFTATFTEPQAAAKNIKITKIVFKPANGAFSDKGTISVPAYTSGNFTYLTFDGNTASYAVIPTGGVAVANYGTEIPVPHAVSDVAMLLPQDMSQKLIIEVTVTYENAEGVAQPEKTITITSKDNFAWSPNKIYNYKFTINVARNILDYKSIEIGDPSIADWDAETDA